jgi:competence protein ComGC
MIEIIIVVLIILLLVMGYALWNLTRKTDALEETLFLYESWIENFAITVEKIDNDLTDLDTEGTFRADDEIGYFYQAMYSILKRLEEFKLVEPEELNEAENLLHERDRERHRRIQRVRRSEIQIEDIQGQDRKTFKQVSREHN